MPPFDTHNSLVGAEHKMVTTVGVGNLVVVATKDSVLVSNKEHVQDYRKVVEFIENDGRHEHMYNRQVYRPLGVYDLIHSDGLYQVKRITVTSGAKLSVQIHHHAAEHWVVVSDTAKVINEDREFG